MTLDGYIDWLGGISTVELEELLDGERVILWGCKIRLWWLHDGLGFGGGLWVVVLGRRALLSAPAKEVLLISGESRC